MRIEAVDVRHLQGVATADFRNIGDACRENALFSRQLLVDDIGDLVRRHPELAGRDVVFHAHKLRLLQHVEQAECDLQAIVR